MSTVLAYTSPARGHLYPIVPILTELRARGHEAVVCTLADEVDRMRALGLKAEPLDPRVEALPLQDWRRSGPKAALTATAEAFAARAEYDAPALQELLSTLQPDALLVDTNAWGAQAVAESWGGPWSSYCPFPVPLRSADAPPFGLGLPPARGMAGRARDRVVAPLLLGAVTKATLPRVNEVRAGLSVPPLTDSDQLYTNPPMMLYLTAEPFEYPRSDWPDSFVLVGPCQWEPESAAPAWFDEVDRPVVLVTTSSEYQADEKLARTALEALADEDVYTVVTLPSADPSAFATPGNARVERFVPHGPVLDRAVCAVTHAGMGATQKALARGVPVCAVPFGRDQFEVARRVEVSGSGTRLPSKRLSPERLRAAVREAIGRREGAARVAEAFAAAGGPQAAADAVEQRLL